MDRRAFMQQHPGCGSGYDHRYRDFPVKTSSIQGD
jgi:hypothetical protein